MSDKFAQVLVELLNGEQPRGTSSLGSVNRAEATMDAIKNYILRHELTPGDPLPTELTLCEELGVSRSSVREALRKLEALDIVSVHQGRGTFVGEMSMRPLIDTLIFRNNLEINQSTTSLKEVVAMRKYLDLGICKDVVRAHKGRKALMIYDIVNEMEELARKGENFMEADIAFHRSLFAPINNSLVDQMMSAMWLVHMAVVPNLEQSKDDLLATALAHREIIDAAVAGDRARFRKAVLAHYAPLDRILENADNQIASTS